MESYSRKAVYLLLAMVGLYLMANFIGETLVMKFIKIGPIIGPGGLVVLPFVFLIEDIIAEIFGYRISRYLLWLIVLTSLLYAFISFFVVHLSSPSNWHEQWAFDVVIDPLVRTAPLALFASFCGRYINIYLITKLKLYARGRYFWLRSIFSTFFGSIIALAIFFAFAFKGEVERAELMRLLFSDLSVRMLYAIVGGFFASLLVIFIKVKLQVNFTENVITFNPFKLD